MITLPPFHEGDLLEFKKSNHGVRIPIRTIRVLRIGIEKTDPRRKDAWRVKIAINGKPYGYWAAGWFKVAR